LQKVIQLGSPKEVKREIFRLEERLPLSFTKEAFQKKI